MKIISYCFLFMLSVLFYPLFIYSIERSEICINDRTIKILSFVNGSPITDLDLDIALKINSDYEIDIQEFDDNTNYNKTIQFRQKILEKEIENEIIFSYLKSNIDLNNFINNFDIESESKQILKKYNVKNIKDLGKILHIQNIQIYLEREFVIKKLFPLYIRENFNLSVVPIEILDAYNKNEDNKFNINVTVFSLDTSKLDLNSKLIDEFNNIFLKQTKKTAIIKEFIQNHINLYSIIENNTKWMKISELNKFIKIPYQKLKINKIYGPIRLNNYYINYIIIDDKVDSIDKISVNLEKELFLQKIKVKKNEVILELKLRAHVIYNKDFNQ